MGRYFFRTGRRIKGPLDAAEIVTLLRLSQDSLLCPEDLSPKARQNWRRASTFPDIWARIQALAAAPSRPQMETDAPDPDSAAPMSMPGSRIPEHRWVPLTGAVLIAALAIFGLERILDRWTSTDRERAGLTPAPRPPAGDPSDEGLAALAASRTLSDLFRSRGIRTGEASVTRAAGRPFEIQWDTPCGSAILRASGRAGEFLPVNDAARRLLDGRSSCR